MIRSIFKISLSGLGLCIALSGCSGFKSQQREPWRREAELACIKSGLVKESPYVKITKPLQGPGTCGADYPIKLAAVETETTASIPNARKSNNGLMLTSLTPEGTLSCPMVSGTDRWISQSVQVAALGWFKQPVTEVRTFGTYACRPRNNQSGSRASEHSYANGIDIKAFVLADGRVISVLNGWKGASDEQGFLRETLYGACLVYTTVLGPGSNAFHYDHFHFDLARHDAKGQKHYCRPYVTVPPRPGKHNDDFTSSIKGSKSKPPIDLMPDDANIELDNDGEKGSIPSMLGKLFSK